MSIDPLNRNTFRARVLAGEPSIGAIASIASAMSAATLARAGCHHVVIDTQHGEWDETHRLHALRAVALQGVSPVARVVTNSFAAIGRALDAGALNIVVPMVNSADEARAAAFAMRYPPRGGRSSAEPMAVHLAAGYGSWANDETFLAVQIETAEALAHADEILAVEGVDGCWVGPMDLALTMGTRIGTPEHDAALQSIADACRRTGKVAGMFTGSPASARRWVAAGYRFVTVGTDLSWMERAVQAMLAEVAGAE